MMKKLLKVIYWVFIFFLIRYFLYDLDILKVTTINYKNNKIDIIGIKKINIVTKKNKFISIGPSFVVLLDELNMDFLFKVFNPKKIFILSKNVSIRFYNIESKEYKMYTNYLQYNKQHNFFHIINSKNNCKILREEKSKSYYIYDKYGLLILEGVITNKLIKNLCKYK